jgi:hypothetical protein
MFIKDNKIYEIAYHIIDYKNIEAQDAASHILFTHKYNNDDSKYIIFNCKDCYVYAISEYEIIDYQLYKKLFKLDKILDKELYLLLFKFNNSYKLIKFNKFHNVTI